MGKFEVIECKIEESRYTLVYEIGGVKHRYDSIEDNLTKDEFILKVKNEL
jgi:hypothetical protein